MAGVKRDKLREVRAGHDGTWIAHPLIRQIAMEVFDEHMLGPHQMHVLREEVVVRKEDLVNTNVGGQITEEGIKGNIEAALSYCTAWVSGNGCIPINNLMEDAATAEIARVQLWQWVFHAVTLDTGVTVTADYVKSQISAIAPQITSLVANVKSAHVEIAKAYLIGEIDKAAKGQYASEFLTSDLMPYLDAQTSGKAKI